MWTDVKLLQFLKAPLQIYLTLFGIVTEVNPVQPKNAYWPMDVTVLGMVTEVKPLQPRKADFV